MESKKHKKNVNVTWRTSSFQNNEIFSNVKVLKSSKSMEGGEIGEGISFLYFFSI